MNGAILNDMVMALASVDGNLAFKCQCHELKHANHIVFAVHKVSSMFFHLSASMLIESFCKQHESYECHEYGSHG